MALSLRSLQGIHHWQCGKVSDRLLSESRIIRLVGRIETERILPLSPATPIVRGTSFSMITLPRKNAMREIQRLLETVLVA